MLNSVYIGLLLWLLIKIYLLGYTHCFLQWFQDEQLSVSDVLINSAADGTCCSKLPAASTVYMHQRNKSKVISKIQILNYILIFSSSAISLASCYINHTSYWSLHISWLLIKISIITNNYKASFSSPLKYILGEKTLANMHALMLA